MMTDIYIMIKIIVFICQLNTVKFKSAMINFNEIIGPIELAIVKWAQHCPLTSPVRTLEDLTNAELFIYFLRKITFFPFVESCTYNQFSELALGEKISRMKLIGRSIIAYYKREMMKDIGETHFNFVEICTGNKEQLIRLIIMFMGIIVTSFEILQELESYMSTSEEENIAYMKIMIDYAKKMSEKDQESNDSPIKKQKRLITKLQILEEQVQFYEEYTKQLQGKVERLSEEAERYQKDITDNAGRSLEMLKRIDQLEANSEGLINQIAKKTSSEELLNAKLAKNRQLADETISKLILDIDKHKQQTIYYKKLVKKYEQVDALNKELSMANSQFSKQLLSLKAKYDKMMNNLHKKEEQLQEAIKNNNELSLENDSLKLKIELIQKSFTNNRSIHFSPEQKSIVIHNPLDLSSTSNHNNFTWFNFKQKEMQMNNERHMGDSLTLTLKSNESFIQSRLNLIGMQQNKENDINYGNYSSMQQVQCNLNNIAEQKSFELDMDQVNTLMKLKSERDFQFQFSIQMITELYDYMESLRKQLKKYQLKEAKQLERTLTFKHKVKSMFE